MKNIIIDANNILHRAVARTDSFMKKNGLSHKIVQGVDVSTIQSFFVDLFYSTTDFHEADSTIYIVWDRKIDPSATNWRNDVNPLYKGNRDSARESKDKVHKLCMHVKRVCDAMGLQTVFPLSSEGDDIINYLKNNLDGNSVIVSVDQDFYQCVDENTCIYNPQKRITLTEMNFEEYVPVALEHYVLWKSIKGDPSDNIKGLYRYGEKKAKKLVEDWDNLSAKLNEEQMESITEARTIIDLNHRPLTPKEVRAVEMQLGNKPTKLTDAKLTKVFDTYGIKNDNRMQWDTYFNLKEFDFLND